VFGRFIGRIRDSASACGELDLSGVRVLDDYAGGEFVRQQHALRCGSQCGQVSGRAAAFDACTRAVMTHGGMGYSTEYQVERLFRESILLRIAPITEQLILSFIAEKVLDLPKSY